MIPFFNLRLQYQKIQKERAFEESKHNKELSREHKQKQKKLHKSYDDAQTKKNFDNRF